MPKSRQLVARVDDDLADLVEAAVEDFHRSKADVISAALYAFQRMTPAQKKQALIDYLMRPKPREVDEDDAEEERPKRSK
jgi:hypothetical protein